MIDGRLNRHLLLGRQPYLLYLAAAGAAAYLVCIGTGTLLVRATARPFQPHSK
jgi:hypothetical protein